MSRQEAERIAAAIARAERPHFDAYGNEVRRILIQSHMRTAEAVLADLADEGLLADPVENERLRAALDEAQLRSIEARNPGIDMDEVRRSRLAVGTPEEQTPDERQTR